MFAEDLAQFFDTDGFAVEAVLRDAGGTELRAVNVILETPVRGVGVFDGETSAGTPSARARTEDLAGVRRGHTLTAGADVYSVTGPPEDDGTGVSTVPLKKQ